MTTRAETLYKRGNVRGAVLEFQKVLQIAPQSDGAHAGLGSAFFDLDQNAQAIKHLRQALAINPNNGRALVILGNVYQAQGKTKEAKDAYVRYLKVEPNGKFANDVRLILDMMK